MFYNLQLWEFIYVIKIVHSSFMPNFKMFRAGLQMRSTTFNIRFYPWLKKLGALVEYLILTSCPLYDIEKKKFNSEIWPTLSVDPDQVESAGFITLMGSVMSFAVKMQKLSLKDEELALLYSLAIMSPGKCHFPAERLTINQ